MSHTPGPWRVEDGGFVGGPVGFGRVCQMWNKFEEDFTNSDDNARLIAAAPETAAERNRLREINAELLDALKHARKQMRRSGFCFEMDDELGNDGYRSIDAAIAKSEPVPKPQFGTKRRRFTVNDP